MEESKQQKLFLQMQHQQQLQQRQQQLFLMQHLQKQQQPAAMMSRFPTNTDAHLRLPGLIQNRPVNPSLQNANPNLSSGPKLIQHTNNFQQQQQNGTSEQMMMMMQQQQKPMMKMQQQQQPEKSMRPSNQLELQLAYQDAWRVCNPDFKQPFTSLEDACERLLPYHVVADYEAEEDDRILDSDQTLSRSQQWDNNIAAKVAEFTATFEKQVQAFNVMTQKSKDGELRTEEVLMVEQYLLLEERKACIEVKSELDREMKAQEARLRMAGQVKAESHQYHTEMMARNPFRANAFGNHGGQQRRNMNPDEMMMHGWVNNNSINSQREEKERLGGFLNDEENENGETGQHENWRGDGGFDLNTR